MEATGKDLEGLLQLQAVDISRINAEKRLGTLPQRAKLQELAQKKQGVLEKLDQVGKMFDAARRKVTQIEDEAAILGRKRDETQKKIDEASGDFRAVQSLTRDLDGIAKRLATLEDEQVAADEKFTQVEAVKKQVEQAISMLDAQAMQLRDAFQRDSSALNAEIEQLCAQHDELARGISADVLKAYQDACKRSGGIGVARLEESRCTTCRNLIDPNRLLIVKREAPLSRCPSCRRLLIVE